MGKYFNPGNGAFQGCLDDIYVDKSGLIRYTNSRILKQNKYICVSRPRRFGKSYAANMLTAYYSCGCNSHSQFDSLDVSKDESYEKHINKYNVIRIDVFGDLLSYDEKNTVQEKTDILFGKIIKQIEEEYPDVPYEGEHIDEYFSKVYAASDIPFVFIFDEWDAVFRSASEDEAGQKYYLIFLSAILKERDYVALAYMTGIFPIKKYGDESALNMFQEITMTNASPLQVYTGFTAAEVEDLCTKFNRSAKEFDDWYDGYIVNGESIYNPKSVIESLLRGVSDNYWTTTQSFDSLKGYIEDNAFGIHEIIIKLLAGGTEEVNTSNFKNDVESRNSVNNILTLLVHLGYLTYDFDSKTVSIPNKEITDEFVSVIDDIGWESYISDYEEKKKVLDATLAGDAKTVAEIIARTHRAYAEKYSNHEATLSAVLRESYSPALKNYSMVPEIPAGGGIADYILIPNKKIPDKPLIVLELKSKKYAKAEGAIDQIKKNHYDEALSAYTGEILLVGISYNTVREDHDCVIEKTVKTK